MKIKLSELRAITELLYKYFEEMECDEFEITEDYYWLIPQEEVYDPSKNPHDLVIGQLYEDWDDLNGILTKGNPPVGYAFVWLSSILRFIGEKSGH